VVMGMGVLGAIFMVREWWPLFVIGMWAYMTLVPPAEAAEQTVIQKVVPFERQGRVFGVAAAMEAAATPVTAFLIAPLAEFVVIPYMKTSAGNAQWGWLLGAGEARGIALICLFAGIVVVVVAALAFFTRSYRQLTELYANAPDLEGSDGVDHPEAVEPAGGVDAAEPTPSEIDGSVIQRGGILRPQADDRGGEGARV
ncbi:MAG: hypothetical protein QM630_10320, partial [Microbacterium sp.]